MRTKLGSVYLFWIIMILAVLMLSSQMAYAITKVGNSDDGTDLEGATRLESGSIVDAREKAVKRLKKLNLPAVEGLGNLLPEVQKTDLYIASKDITTSLPADEGHASVTGLVYARTFAEPHAATRFFPIAEKLGEDQLIALHIHEGLHRALPESVRSDEKVVASLTLAITAPQATFDSVNQSARELIPKETQRAEDKYVDFASGSNLGYTYKQFFKPNKPTTYEVTSMHMINSHLFPFGNKRTRFGMGIEMALVNGPGGANMGPLGLSANFRVFNYQGFVFRLWGALNLNTLSAEELKQSPFGRDVVTLGFAIRKNLKNAYVENYTSVDFEGDTKQRVGAVDYNYKYGSIIDVKIRAGLRVWKIDVGGYGELHLADYFKVEGGAFNYDSGRFRIFSVGPEMGLNFDDYSVSLFARILVNSTKDANYDFLGHLMGPGVSQGSGGVSFKLLF